MSKAEEAAMKAFPIREDFYRHDGVCRSQTLDLNEEKRNCFLKGYHQAEKDIIEKVVSWLQSNIGNREWMMDFRKYLEEDEI